MNHEDADKDTDEATVNRVPFKVSRRDFVVTTGVVTAAAAVLPLPGYTANKAFVEETPVKILKPTAEQKGPLGYHDRYREKWSWDSVTKTTHATNCGNSNPYLYIISVSVPPSAKKNFPDF